MSLKYVFHEKNVFRSEKTRFLAKKVIFYHKSLLYKMIMRIYRKDIRLKESMGSTQVIESTVQHHLAPFCCFSLRAIEVVTEWWILC